MRQLVDEDVRVEGLGDFFCKCLNCCLYGKKGVSFYFNVIV